MATDVELTPASLDLFMRFARDAANWSGNPPLDGNVVVSAQDRGNLTHLKRLELLTTEPYQGTTWVNFTQRGREFARRHGVDLSWIRR